MYDIEVLREKRVRANKNHVCDTCHSVIKKGEHYDNQTNIADNMIYTWRNCDHCKELRLEAFDYYYNTWGIASMDSDSFYNYIDECGVEFKRRT